MARHLDSGRTGRHRARQSVVVAAVVAVIASYGVAGPVSRTEVIETGITDREANMVEFTTRSLRMLRDAIREAGT